jgi:PAS domain S-box-containing protein
LPYFHEATGTDDTSGGSAPGALPLRVVAAFGVVALALVLGGRLFYQSQERYQRNDAQEALQAVSRLKVNQISGWREDRLSDGAVLSADSGLANQILRYLSAPTPAGEMSLRSGLAAWKEYKAYADVAVADAGGNIIFSLRGQSGRLPEGEASALRDALSQKQPVLTELHREPGVAPHVSVAAPLFATAGGKRTAAGAVILRSDAASALYPLIISWPTASRSAETLLVRRDGDAMLFLNELRQRQHTSLELRMPLSRHDNPSAMAGNGSRGMVQGVDYRGVAVLADIRAVPGTPWLAVTKVDLDEAMAPWRAGSIQITCLLAGLVATVAALFLALWQFRAKAQHQLLTEAAAARAGTAARLASIVDSSQDAIVATTMDGVVIAWNHGAESLLGYSAAEMVGCPMDQPIGRLASRGARTDNAGILERLSRGERVEHYEERRLAKSGRMVDMSISVSPIRDASGRIIGLSRIGRDITEEKRVRRDLDRLRWMLSPPAGLDSAGLPQEPAGHLAGQNTVRVILDAAGGPLLSEIAAVFQALVGTCFTVNEGNGDLAYSVQVADWCRFVHASSGGMCHKHCGKDFASQAMARGEPVEAECSGGLRLYALPIRAGVEVVGALSMGYGEPSTELLQLVQLAEQLGVEPAELERHAARYETRPPFIVELAKERLVGSAHLLGEIVQRHRGESLLREARDKLARSNR